MKIGWGLLLEFLHDEGATCIVRVRDEDNVEHVVRTSSELVEVALECCLVESVEAWGVEYEEVIA